MIPEPLRTFWYAMSGLNQRCRRTAWGAVVSDPRFPLVWDANHAAILEDVDGLSGEEIRGVLHPALRDAGAPFEHLEFWEPAETPALRDLRREGNRRDPDLDLVFHGAAPAAPSSAFEIREIDDPDDRFLDWYRDSRVEFGGDLSGEVLDQLLGRDLIVFLPAGLRWFVAYAGGAPAGFTSLISLAGIGYLDGVITMPAFRRKGVATATVTAAIRASLGQGDAFVHLLAEERGQARRLYERLGFRSWGRVHSFTRRLPQTS